MSVCTHSLTFPSNYRFKQQQKEEKKVESREEWISLLARERETMAATAKEKGKYCCEHALNSIFCEILPARREIQIGEKLEQKSAGSHMSASHTHTHTHTHVSFAAKETKVERNRGHKSPWRLLCAAQRRSRCECVEGNRRRMWGAARVLCDLRIFASYHCMSMMMKIMSNFCCSCASKSLNYCLNSDRTLILSVKIF